MVFSVYKPCDASPTSFAKLLDFISNCIEGSKDPYTFNILILGDLNFPEMWNANSEIINSTSGDEEKLSNFMTCHLLSQYVQVPTRDHNILDLCLTNVDKLIYQVSSEKTILSDHNIVNILLSAGELSIEKIPTPPLSVPCGFQSLNLFDADFTKISNELSTIDWQSVWKASNLEDFPNVLYSTVLNVCKKFTPIKSQAPSKPKKDRQYKSLLRKLKKVKSRLKCIETLQPSSSKCEILKKEILLTKEKIKEYSFSMLEKKEKKAISKIKKKPKYFYKYVKNLAKVKQKITQLYDEKGELKTDLKSICDILQNQFISSFSDPSNPEKHIPFITSVSQSSLSDISASCNDIIQAIDQIDINAACPDFSLPAVVLKKCKNELAEPLLLLWKHSFQCGIVPAFYKQQLISPIHKKGSRALSNNYRPISLTAHEIKIFERIIRDQLISYLESNNLLSSFQHGFRKGKSCLSQLLKHYDNILENLLDHNETDSIFLDFAKAFDKVDHQILLQKVKNLGITGNLYNWLANFLNNRQQVVVVNGVASFIAAVISGVPQGTVLGPILFLIFINDISTDIQHSVISCFADDTRLSKSISTEQDSLLLQEDLNKLLHWAKLNNMEMHEDKFVYVNFNNRSKHFFLPLLPFYYDRLNYSISKNISLEPSPDVKDLGIMFTPNLSWSTHIATLTSAARRKAGWVLSCIHDRSPNTMLTLYKLFVRSRLEYGCPLWNGLSLTEVREIEAIQRSFTNRINCPPDVTNYWDRLKYFQLMSLQRRRERYTIVYMWKIYYCKISNDLGISFADNARFGPRAIIPPLQSSVASKAQNIFDKSFAVKGPQMWNIVPKNVKIIKELERFKIELNKWLLNIPDRPPVHGYVTQNNNLILEWSSTGSL